MLAAFRIGSQRSCSAFKRLTRFLPADRHRLEPHLLEGGNGFRLLHRGNDGCMQLGDDRLGRALGRQHHVARADIDACQAGLRHRGKVGRQRCAPVTDDRQRLQLAALHVGQHVGQREHPDLDVTRQQIRQRGSVAAIGHLVELHAGLLHEKQAGQVVRCAHAGRRVVDLPRLLLGEFDQFLHIVGRKCRVCSEHDRCRGEVGDRHEVLHGVELQVGKDVFEDRGGVAVDDQRVAGRRRGGGRRHADRRACTALVVDDDRLSDLAGHALGQLPGDGVGAPSWREGHDHLDLPIRKFGRRRPCPQGRAGRARSAPW